MDGPSFSEALAGVMMPEPEADAISKAPSTVRLIALEYRN